MEQQIKQNELNEIAEVSLIYKSKVKPSQRPKISCSKDAADIFRQNWDDNKIELVEQFKVLLLNKSNKVLGIIEISSGGVTATVVDPKIVFIAALKANACGLIISHNHPSGNLKPSRQDEEITRKIKNAGDFLDLHLMDHIILSTEGYYSFADEGLI